MIKIALAVLALSSMAVSRVGHSNAATPDGIPKVVALLKSDDLQVRREALRELADLGAKAKSAEIHLLDFLVRTYREERKKEYPCLHCEASIAVRALGSMGSVSPATEGALLSFLRVAPQDTEFDQELIYALGKVGTRHEKIVPATGDSA